MAKLVAGFKNMFSKWRPLLNTACTPPFLLHCIHCAEWKQPPPCSKFVYSLSSALCEASFHQRDKITMGTNIDYPAKAAHALHESRLMHSLLRPAFTGGKSILPTSAKYLVPADYGRYRRSFVALAAKERSPSAT
jgi:hypothetical protein